MNLVDHLESGQLTASFPLALDEPFTYAHALAAGLTRRNLQCLLDHGLIRRIVYGVYGPARLPDTVATRAHALRLVTPDGCVVVDRHAGWLHGAQMVLAPGEHLELRPLSLYRTAGAGRLRRQHATSGERNLGPSDVTEVHGVVVSTPIRTAWDLGRVRWPDQAISGLDALFSLDVFSRGEFLAGIERFRRMRWVSTLRAVGPLADGRSESPGESVLRLRCIECRLAGMVPQVEVWRGEEFVARLDLADEGLMAAVEYDGVEWHSTEEQKEHDRVRRENASAEGWLVASFGKAQVFGRHRTIEDDLARFREHAHARRRAG